MKADDFKISQSQFEVFFSGGGANRFGIFPKGRRFGATRGAAIAFTKWMLEGDACLWGDTINSNIDRYVERYFFPFLRFHGIDYKWNSIKKLLLVGDGFTDFRSADRPENWEGFGYNKIFLNEAGIILHNEYLYYNAVLPMLVDFSDSQLIAAGTPKLLSGRGRLFYDLWKKVEQKEQGYYGKTLTTYDNPFLTRDQISELEKQIPAYEREQEISGVFVLSGGAVIKLDWFMRFYDLPCKPQRIVQSWDTANKASALNDPSVCTTWAEYDGFYFLIDVFRDWLEYPKLKKAAINNAARFNPDVILIEDKSSGQSLIQDLRADSDFSYNVVAIEPVGDKTTRMATASLPIEQGLVFIPYSASWLGDYESELMSFPNSGHDDQADSTSQYLNWVKKPNEIFIG